MQGQTLSKNFRRNGIRSKFNGQPNPLHPMMAGPTAERLAKAENHYAVGDDQRGNRVYHFHDCPIDRLYSRLTRQAKSLSAEQGLRREYIALVKYRHHWFSAGLQDAIGSADLNRIFASDPGSMSGMAKSERQAHHRQQYRQARDGENGIGHKAGIVVDNVVCAEMSLETAGYSVGFNSRTHARDKAEEMLRESGRKLARLWGIS
ncbi:hypothetical protein [Bradyrhizobium sp. LA2.1]|uniref:hypothetical protein n=1 Tax=Bradyrhizobium sp. LA2.1 TaxID=3156376 RepID=UPI00339AD0CD